VVLDLRGEAGRHSVYVLYNPYRVVVDFERLAAGIATTHAPARAVVVSAPAAETVHVIPAAGDATTAITTAVRAATAVPAAVTAPPARSAPVPSGPPAANVSGGFSLARQLGLGISKVVIDPGHGGHDPGAKVRGLTEAELVLDVALRLERLLEDQSGIEVVLTRRTNVYVSLEERTAIANRASADLFLSIHVNASKNARASGVESYVLNFAPNATARAVAARENASSARQMRHLPDLVRALALNNKRDESRDLAASLQTALYRQLRRSNRDVRDLGVKQAPFMVLLGATMPSALTEISFITNRDEAARLRTDAYRQLLADGLHAGLLRYQQSVKRPPAIATR
jgi:N-acetylmuramoyl-L-alanine amidase